MGVSGTRNDVHDTDEKVVKYLDNLYRYKIKVGFEKGTYLGFVVRLRTTLQVVCFH